MIKEYHYSLTPRGPYLRSVFTFGLAVTCPLMPPHQRHETVRLARIILFDTLGHHYDEDAVLDFCEQMIEWREPPWELKEQEIADWLAARKVARTQEPREGGD